MKAGIFYSNNLLDNDYLSEISDIDTFLQQQQLSLNDNMFPNVSIKQLSENKIKNYVIRNVNFSKGFTNKTFHIFSKNELKTIRMILQ